MGNSSISSPKVHPTAPLPVAMNHSISDRLQRVLCQQGIRENERVLRLRILDDMGLIIQFPKPTLIILFAPPEFGIEKLAQFLSLKLDLPILKLLNHHSTNLSLEKKDSDLNERDKADQIDIDLMTEVQDQLLKFTRGCIMYDYPSSMKHYRFLCQVSDYEQIPIFFEIDPHVVRHMNHKFDRWIHSPTNRSYHLISNPPQSNPGSHLPTEINMFDDATGECLEKLPEDTPQFYKTRLRDFRVLEFLMRSRLEARYFTVPPMGSRVATERFVLKILCQVSARQEQLVQGKSKTTFERDHHHHHNYQHQHHSIETKRVKLMKKLSTMPNSEY